MKFLSHMIQPLLHCEEAAIYLLNSLGVRVTSSTLRENLTEHPNYPSLLAISDVMKTYGVNSIALRLEKDSWNASLDAPFLVHIKSRDLRHDVFAVVTKHFEREIEIYNPEIRKIQRIERNDFFENYYNGTAMLVEANENSGERDYEKHLRIEKRKHFFYLFSILLLPAITFATCIVYINNNSINNSVFQVTYTLLTLIGVIISIMLLWHEIDEYNPVVRQICQAGKKINCSAILSSDASKIFGISWSSIGATYFIGMQIALISAGLFSPPIIVLLSWINVMALPYVGFSLYYQGRVAKQWCVLCLAVQTILVAQFITALFGGLHQLVSFEVIPVHAYLTVIGLFAVVFTAINILIPALQKAKTSRLRSIELQRLKHNPQIFEALLTKQKAIKHSTTDLGIRLGNSNGKYKITKVCNPYCGPCAKAHPQLDILLENNNEIDLQIIFTATNNEKDIKRDPVLHLLAIASEGNNSLLKQALDDWYGAPDKSYTNFSKKYPIKGDLEQHSERISAMQNWCDSTEIEFTPTFFINGRQLPKIYSVADLKYFLMD